MTIKYGLQFFFFELTDNDGQNFVAGIVPNTASDCKNARDRSSSTKSKRVKTNALTALLKQ
jgi:hypothetical protein